MLIRQLEYLVALGHEKHFPALSLAVKQIEAEHGVSIVQRGNRFSASLGKAISC